MSMHVLHRFCTMFYTVTSDCDTPILMDHGQISSVCMYMCAIIYFYANS